MSALEHYWQVLDIGSVTVGHIPSPTKILQQKLHTFPPFVPMRPAGEGQFLQCKARGPVGTDSQLPASPCLEPCDF